MQPALVVTATSVSTTPAPTPAPTPVPTPAPTSSGNCNDTQAKREAYTQLISSYVGYTSNIKTVCNYSSPSWNLSTVSGWNSFMQSCYGPLCSCTVEDFAGPAGGQVFLIHFVDVDSTTNAQAYPFGTNDSIAIWNGSETLSTALNRTANGSILPDRVASMQSLMGNNAITSGWDNPCQR